MDSIITYVLLCGYTPFRSDDPKELVRETARGRLEFHDRYWRDVSEEGKLSAIGLEPANLVSNHLFSQSSERLYSRACRHRSVEATDRRASAPPSREPERLSGVM